MPYSTKQQRCILRCLEDRPEEAMTAGEVAEYTASWTGWRK